MNEKRRPEKGIFAGLSAKIREFHGLTGRQTIRQRSVILQFVRNSHYWRPLDDFKPYVRGLYGDICANRGKRSPSKQNWRRVPQPDIGGSNRSPEVVLERAIAGLFAKELSPEWWNQMPVASGLVDRTSNKRAAVDLVRLKGNRLDLFELKWCSDNPVFAAYEVLFYGLAYILCRVNHSYGYVELETMQANHIGLNVLAPECFYAGRKQERLDLEWLQSGIEYGFQEIVSHELGAKISASFRFGRFPTEFTQLFEAKVAAGKSFSAGALSEETPRLVAALADLQPVYPVI